MLPAMAGNSDRVFVSYARADSEFTLQYCSAYETLNSAAIQKVFPGFPQSVQNQLRVYESLECTVGAPRFDRLDAGPAGGAQVRFDMKQVVVMKSGAQSERSRRL
jgi:hypothetical protein